MKPTSHVIVIGLEDIDKATEPGSVESQAYERALKDGFRLERIERLSTENTLQLVMVKEDPDA